MTTIASNVALTLLAQPSPLLAAPLLASSSAGGARSAADTILAIVSAAASAGEKPADAAPAPTARAVGGTVSSELSKPQLSAMAAAGSMVTTYDPIAAANGFTPIKASVENAEAFIRHLAAQVEQFNDGLEPDLVPPTRDEYNATYQKWAEKRIAAGEDAEAVAKDVSYFTSDEYYSDLVDGTKSRNLFRKTAASYAVSAIETSQSLLAAVFNQKDIIERDGNGRISLKNMTIRYGNGNTMIVFDNKDGLTTFNEDGSIRGRYSLKDVISI